MTVIRSLLVAIAQSADRRNKGQIWMRNYLVDKNMTSEEVIRSIESKSIIALPQEALYSPKSAKDIVSIDTKFLVGNFSIVSGDSDSFEIIPIRSLTAMNTIEMQTYHTDQRNQGIKLSVFERSLGYGNNNFLFERYTIPLDCCLPTLIRYPRSKKSPEWHANQIITRISTGKSPNRNNLVVSNCGEILHRNDEGETRFFF